MSNVFLLSISSNDHDKIMPSNLHKLVDSRIWQNWSSLVLYHNAIEPYDVYGIEIDISQAICARIIWLLPRFI